MNSGFLDQFCVLCSNTAQALSPAELWGRIEAAYSSAEARGAAYRTDTCVRLLRDPQDPRRRFVLRVATALRDKPKPPKPTAPDGRPARNPFLPYEEALWVGHLSPSHTLLLNKFNVVAHHLLVVTRAFEPQSTPLSAGDLGATWRVMQAMPHGGLAYFNCGEHSGASQPHKHTQVVPLPLASEAEAASAACAEGSLQRPAGAGKTEEGPAGGSHEAPRVESTLGASVCADAPELLQDGGCAESSDQSKSGQPQADRQRGKAEAAVSPLFEAAADEALRGAGAAAWEACAVRSLPFQCFCAALPEREEDVTGEALAGAFEALQAAAFQHINGQGLPSFNVLLTRRHMALVPRSREAWGPVSINSVGFAGSLLVRSLEELAFIEAQGPLRILTEVGRPWTV